MTPDSESFDVSLVGSGPTGAMLAYLLGRQGVRTLAILGLQGLRRRWIRTPAGRRLELRP